MPILFLIWMACGAIGYAMGNAKGKAATGLILGLLLGVIGLVITALLSDSPAIAMRKHQQMTYALNQQGARQSPAHGPAGWYPDPYRRHESRYFDGAVWTAHVSSNGVQSEDAVNV